MSQKAAEADALRRAAEVQGPQAHSSVMKGLMDNRGSKKKKKKKKSASKQKIIIELKVQT